MAITMRDKTKEIPALLYVAESMEFMSSAGRRRMMEQQLITSKDIILREQEIVNLFDQKRNDPSLTQSYTLLKHQLMQLHDIATTIIHLMSHMVMDEVELFEIKNLAYLSRHARTALEAMGMHHFIAIPDLSAVFDLLDPDHTGITSFYIYDSYDPRLTPIRKQMKGADDDAMSDLLAQQNEIQAQVLNRLSDQLSPFASDLQTALERMAYTDFAMARAELARQWGLNSPSLSPENPYFRGLFNPRLRDHNLNNHLRYQPVDVALTPGVTLITGANMAGKTVLLKSIGLAQLMYQFGFPVPAEQSAMDPVDDVVFCIGDEQNEMNGLSSFAAEITRISDVLQRSQSEHLLILIDEPARTTNPIEGKALVQSITKLLHSRQSITMITTHYSQLGIPCRRLRVKGFVEDMVDVPLNPTNINRFIDYSLVEDHTDEVPQEALRIAEMMQCDNEMISLARNFLTQ